MRRLVGGWKFLFLDGQPFKADPAQSAQWNRGAYLVNAASHCAECHSPRNALGGIVDAQRFAGGPDLEGEGGWVPNITPKGRLAEYTDKDVGYLLKSGDTPEGDSVGGSMRAVVLNTGELTDDDRAAMAAYLKTLPPIEGPWRGRCGCARRCRSHFARSAHHSGNPVDRFGLQAIDLLDVEVIDVAGAVQIDVRQRSAESGGGEHPAAPCAVRLLVVDGLRDIRCDDRVGQRTKCNKQRHWDSLIVEPARDPAGNVGAERMTDQDDRTARSGLEAPDDFVGDGFGIGMTFNARLDSATLQLLAERDHSRGEDAGEPLQQIDLRAGRGYGSRRWVGLSIRAASQPQT
jgi:mono/diheme cytochrome c family protein